MLVKLLAPFSTRINPGDKGSVQENVSLELGILNGADKSVSDR